MTKRSGNSRPTLVIGRSDRLLARLKAMLNGWRFIDQVGGRLIVLWPNLHKRYAEENIGYSPGNIFDLAKFYAEGGADRLCFADQSLRETGLKAVPLEGEAFEGCLRTGFDRARFEGSSEIFRPLRPGRYFFADEAPIGMPFVEQGRALFDQLPIHPRILAARDRFYEASGLTQGDFGAIHFRRGDVYTMLHDNFAPDPGEPVDETQWPLLLGHFIVRTAPFEFYRPWVEALIAQGRKIVFTSDSPETVSVFRQEFGAEHFVSLERFGMPLMIQKAFLDFLVLRDASQLIGTSSNFSQFAAELGSKKFVNVIGTGPYAVLEREFCEAILGDREIDPGTRARALSMLDTMYAELVARNAKTVRHS